MDLSRLKWIPLAVYVAWLVIAYEFHFLDFVNLAFHEAGHIFLSPFGTTLGMLGGTIGQLVFPIACAIHFLRLGQLTSALVCGVWLAESLMYVAHYMADAREMTLPLVGGEIHDWNWLFGRLGWLEASEGLAAAVHVLASLLAVALVFALARISRQESLATSEPPHLPEGAQIER